MRVGATGTPRCYGQQRAGTGSHSLWHWGCCAASSAISQVQAVAYPRYSQPHSPGTLIPLKPMARFAKVNGSSLSNPVPISICIIAFYFHISCSSFQVKSSCLLIPGSCLMLQFALKWQPFSPPKLAALPRVGAHVPVHFRKLTYFGKEVLQTCYQHAQQ